jgi:hypothetical protein
MMLSLLFALQAAAMPDIELRATVRARSLTIEKAGTAKVDVTAGGENLVSIEGPKANGRKRIANPVYNVHIEARLADGRAAPRPETPPTDE